MRWYSLFFTFLVVVLLFLTAVLFAFAVASHCGHRLDNLPATHGDSDAVKQRSELSTFNVQLSTFKQYFHSVIAPSEPRHAPTDHVRSEQEGIARVGATDCKAGMCAPESAVHSRGGVIQFAGGGAVVSASNDPARDGEYMDRSRKVNARHASVFVAGGDPIGIGAVAQERKSLAFYAGGCGFDSHLNDGGQCLPAREAAEHLSTRPSFRVSQIPCSSFILHPSYFSFSLHRHAVAHPITTGTHTPMRGGSLVFNGKRSGFRVQGSEMQEAA